MHVLTIYGYLHFYIWYYLHDNHNVNRPIIYQYDARI